jgi:hypothetical protein
MADEQKRRQPDIPSRPDIQLERPDIHGDIPPPPDVPEKESLPMFAYLLLVSDTIRCATFVR